MLIQTAKSQNEIINVVWGARGPGAFGVINYLCFSTINKQIQFSEMIIHATKYTKYSN